MVIYGLHSVMGANKISASEILYEEIECVWNVETKG